MRETENTKLIDWYQNLSAPEKNELALECGVTRNHLWRLIYGKTQISYDIALAIIAYSSGFFDLKDLRKDFDEKLLGWLSRDYKLIRRSKKANLTAEKHKDGTIRAD